MLLKCNIVDEHRKTMLLNIKEEMLADDMCECFTLHLLYFIITMAIIYILKLFSHMAIDLDPGFYIKWTAYIIYYYYYL